MSQSRTRIGKVSSEPEEARRLYREEKLTVRKRDGRKRASRTRRPLALPSRPNERWSLGFVCDAFIDGRRFPVLAVVGDFPRECLVLGARRRHVTLRAAVAWELKMAMENQVALGQIETKDSP